ncbi:MAG TPA: VOC family protein [Chryseosolibacter sp.]
MVQKNAISWFEIPTKDLNRAQAFYEEILDVKLTPLDLENFQMRMFPVEDAATGVGGCLCFSKDSHKPSATEGPLVYLNANPDVQNVLDKVEKAGGKVIVSKTQISPEYGYMAVVIDTEDNRIAFHSTS